MNAIIAAIIFTVGIFLKDFLEPFSSKLKLGERSKFVKHILLFLLLFMGWWQAVLQVKVANKAANYNDFQKQQLVSANSSLSNVTAVAASMDKELTRFRSQSDTDTIQLVDVISSRIAKSEADKYFLMGGFALATGRQEEAKRAYFKCLKSEPTYSEALNNMGIIYRAQGQTNKAMDYFQRAYRANTNNPVPALNYAALLILHGKNLEAQTILSAVKLNQGFTDPDACLGIARWSAQIPVTTTFFGYLNTYVSIAMPPDVQEVIRILSPHLNDLSSEQVSTMTNWGVYFGESDRILLDKLIQSIRAK